MWRRQKKLRGIQCLARNISQLKKIFALAIVSFQFSDHETQSLEMFNFLIMASLSVDYTLYNAIQALSSTDSRTSVSKIYHSQKPTLNLSFSPSCTTFRFV